MKRVEQGKGQVIQPMCAGGGEVPRAVVVNATASPWGHRTVCSKLHVKRGAGDWKPQWIALGAVRVGFGVGASAASHSTAPGVLATCREAQPLGPEDRDPYQGCIRDEGQARAELQRQWAQFDPANRTSCVEETGIGGYPSYVEVMTCLQMYSGTPTTTLKPRRRGD